MSSTPATSPAPLDYGRPGRLLTRRRARWMVLLALLFTILTITYDHRRPIAAFGRRAQMVFWQHRWLTYTPPVRQVVYEEQPASRVALLRRSDFVPFQLVQDPSPRAALWHPAILDEYSLHAQSPLFRTPSGLVFLHERATATGQRVIMTCKLSMHWEYRFIEVGLDVEEYRPATFKKPLARMQQWSFTVPRFTATCPVGKHLRLFAGQPDPADPTHFMIPFEIEDKPGTLDIWDIEGEMSPVIPRLEGLRVEVRGEHSRS